MHRTPWLRPLPMLAILCSASCAGCAPQGSGESIEESAGVVVRLPVQLPDTARPPGPAPGDVTGDVSRDDAPRMEVPAVPDPLSIRVDSALDGLAFLRSRRLMVPVEGIEPASLLDTFGEDRGGGSRMHGALDIPAPLGTPVLAADDGRVEKLHLSDAGGITLYQFDPSGRFVYYYAHLDRYREGIAEGDVVRRGEVLGYVGTTGNAPPGVPHLHFAIGRMDAERRWWKFEPINPLSLLTVPGRVAAGRAPTS